MLLAPIAICLLTQETKPIQDLCDKFKLAAEFRSGEFKDQGKGYQITGDKVTEEGMKKYASIWVTEWSKYSADLFAKVKVTKVVFAEKLSFSGQVRAAVPAWDLNAMYYDPTLGSYSAGFQKTVIHHEFFHMIDYRMGKLSRDADWRKLNPEDFKYGSGGAKMRTPGVGNLTKDIPGFLTMYSTAAMEEDKAELYAHLIVDPGFVYDLAKTDKYLASKIDFLKKRLAEYDPVFTDSFWPKG